MSATTKNTYDLLQARLKGASEACGLTLSLERWSPGDGWTRYRVQVGEDGYCESPYMTRQECLCYLTGMIDCARWPKWMAKRIDHTPAPKSTERGEGT